jgi:hypothetical protein
LFASPLPGLHRWGRVRATLQVRLAMTRVLAYLEPAVFRQHPLFLLPHVQWIRMLAAQLGLGAGDGLLLLSSAALCRAAQPILAAALPASDLRCSALPLPALLAAFDGSVPAYARDLYAPPQAPVRNQALASALQQALDQFQPDLVLATAENRYLAALARRGVAPGGVFFIEKAPLPAWYVPARLYFDNRGHQSNGTLAGCWPAILQANYEPQEIAAAQLLLLQMAARQQRPEGLALRHQVRQACNPGRETLLVALQPADWLSWEGALSEVIDPFGLLGRCCAAFPELNIVPTLHRDMAALRPDALGALQAIYPNLIDLPPACLVGATEDLLPLVDHVYAVSSAVGITALLEGKCLVSDADSYLRGAAIDSASFRQGRRPRLDASQRERLAAFLLGRFSKPIEGLRGLADYRRHAAGLARVVEPGAVAALVSQPARPRVADLRRARFGVFEYSYRGFTHFERALHAGGGYSVNLGDSIQSRAVREALRAIGVREEQITTIDRDSLAGYVGEPLLVVMNAVFVTTSFPLAAQITPVYFGFSFHPDNLLPGQTLHDYEAALLQLRAPGSIGCRDRATAEALAARGLASHVTGCLSQSLAPRGDDDGDGLEKALLLCGIDDPVIEQSLLRQATGPLLWMRDQRRRVAEYPLSRATMAACGREADALLSLYAGHVGCAVTSLMHCASPCAALGIPTVIVRRVPDNLRFGSLREHLPVLAAGAAHDLRQLQRQARTLQLRERMLEGLYQAVDEAFIAQAAH